MQHADHSTLLDFTVERAGQSVVSTVSAPWKAVFKLAGGLTGTLAAANEELVRNNYPTQLAPGAIFMARVVAGDNLVAFSPKDAITNDAGRPIFIVHGTGDERINVHHTRDLQALAEKTGANVTVWMPEGVGHVMAEFALPQEYEQRLVAFFHAALGN